jgi:membrane fusion protein (multidrug efflux system)
MKRKSIMISISVITILLIAGTVRLISNKRYFSEQLQMVSGVNLTVPVITDTVKSREISDEFVENGTFQSFREISLISETQGRVLEVDAETGDYVKEGLILGFTDNNALKSQVELAEYSLLKAEKDLHRFEELSKADAVTIQQSESARQNYLIARSAYITAKTQYQNSYFTAPFNGFVTKRHIEKGTFLFPGTPLFDIVETDRVKLVLKLTDEQITQISRGMHVKVTAGPFTGVDYHGKVSAIETRADLSKRYATEIEVVNNPASTIRPGMFGTGTFTLESDKKQLVIPRRAITGSIQDPEVFVVNADSVILKKIEAATLNDRYVTIKTGLKEGDVLVVSGQINLVNGSKISITR